MKTLLLDQVEWDLVKDAFGNIAAATDPYALAQNVATACRLFIGELWYNTAAGIPYFENILGHNPPIEYIESQLIGAANTVAGVSSAKAIITGIVGRKVTGQVTFKDSTGATQIVQL